MKTDRIEGLKYSQAYVERGAPLEDGEKWRVRLATFVQEEHSRDVQLASNIGRNIGIKVRNGGSGSLYYYYFDRLILIMDLIDLLNFGTEIFEIRNSMGPREQEQWRNHFNKTCAEENVGYEMDEKGGVHPVVDAEFQHNLTSTIKGLNSPRYSTALTLFGGIQPALDRRDTRQAIRQVFDSAENIVKIMTGASRLDDNVVRKSLKNQICKNWQGGASNASASQLLESMKSWVTAAHSYRHVEGQSDAAEPPLDLAILMISLGASYIRWLIDQDQQLQLNQPGLQSV